jgi:hypothetical protein
MRLRTAAELAALALFFAAVTAWLAILEQAAR